MKTQISERFSIINNYVNSMDRDELNALASAINERRRVLSSIERNRFKIGDKVEFTRKAGVAGTVHGTITRINTKSITVVEPNNIHSIWRVSPSLLRHS
jgi:exoribonuclease R